MRDDTEWLAVKALAIAGLVNFAEPCIVGTSLLYAGVVYGNRLTQSLHAWPLNVPDVDNCALIHRACAYKLKYQKACRKQNLRLLSYLVFLPEFTTLILNCP